MSGSSTITNFRGFYLFTIIISEMDNLIQKFAICHKRNSKSLYFLCQTDVKNSQYFSSKIQTKIH